MTDGTLANRLDRIEANVNGNTATAFALLAAVIALPEASRIDREQATTVLQGLIARQPALQELLPEMLTALNNIIDNAARQAGS